MALGDAVGLGGKQCVTLHHLMKLLVYGYGLHQGASKLHYSS